jgi:hypothetical protein
MLILVVLTGCAPQPPATNYYFDAEKGRDDNPGIHPDKPFKSLQKIRQLRLNPGDSILLKAGVVFSGQLYVSCKGDSANPIVIGKYGGPGRPHIKADAVVSDAVHIFNSEHVVIRDLEISNRGPRPIDGLNGLLVELRNYGTARHIVVDSLFIHDVWGIPERDKKGGGNAILLRNFTHDTIDVVSSRFVGLTVQNCVIRNCQRNGITMWGNWVRSRWNPNLGVVIRNNLLEGVPGDGIVPVACEGPRVEYNIMRDCPATLPPTEACDGIWPWSCNNALIQYNVVSGHQSQVDGYGFDSDWNCINTTFQYNLSYNNTGGFLLVCNSGGWPPDWSAGNRGTVVRYNVSINDGLRDYIPAGSKEQDFFSPVIHITGPTKNSRIEKNLFYVLKKPSPVIDKTIVSLTDWGGYPDSTFFFNNYLFFEEPNRGVEAGNSTHNFIDNNVYGGLLSGPASGFIRNNNVFDSRLWYQPDDPHWKNLLAFLADKTVLLRGEQVPVWKLIGFNDFTPAKNE